MPVQRQRLTRNLSTQVQAQSPRLIDTKGWEKPGKLDAPSCGAWTDWEQVMLPHIGQRDRMLTNSMQNSVASETLVRNEGLNSRISKLYAVLMPTHTLMTLGIVGNVEERDDSKVTHRVQPAWEFDS